MMLTAPLLSETEKILICWLSWGQKESNVTFARLWRYSGGVVSECRDQWYAVHYYFKGLGFAVRFLKSCEIQSEMTLTRLLLIKVSAVGSLTGVSKRALNSERLEYCVVIDVSRPPVFITLGGAVERCTSRWGSVPNKGYDLKPPLPNSKKILEKKKEKLPALFFLRVLIRRGFKDQEDRLNLKSLSTLHILCAQ